MLQSNDIDTAVYFFFDKGPFPNMKAFFEIMQFFSNLKATEDNWVFSIVLISDSDYLKQNNDW